MKVIQTDLLNEEWTRLMNEHLRKRRLSSKAGSLRKGMMERRSKKPAISMQIDLQKDLDLMRAQIGKKRLIVVRYRQAVQEQRLFPAI